jgi:hypothetical protein
MSIWARTKDEMQIYTSKDERGKKSKTFFKNIKRFSSLSHSIKNKIPNPDQKNNLQI